jgi:hypothetical protein
MVLVRLHRRRSRPGAPARSALIPGRAPAAGVIALVFALAFALPAANPASAQTATVTGQVVLEQNREPLGFTTVAVLSQGMQLLTGESGRFMLVNLPPGEVRLRFKRIGFSPKDTAFTVAANDTARITVDMTQLVLQLPAMIVVGKCTDRSPFEIKAGVLEELFDQVNQNAEQARLLADARPFLLQAYRIRGHRMRDEKIAATRIDTVVRRPLPEKPYRPREVLRRGEGLDAGEWHVAIPELPDLADTAFTNNHCFRYAGQTRFEADSVIQVDFEPVPWLDKEVDIKGSLYLKVDGYQIVGTVTMLNRIPSQFRRAGLQELSVRARFTEFVSGIPVLDEWMLTNRFRAPRLPFVEVGQVLNVRWTDSTTTPP